jgi:Ca-activated chloride channel family protein
VTFTWPAVLWALGLVAALAWSLTAAERRRRSVESRLADAHLFARIAGVGGVRARWPVALYLAALVLLVFAAARPVASVPLPTNRAALVLAIDASQSMMAEDIKPTRLEAARLAARALVRAMPRSLQIGLVTFSDAATVLVAPTTDRHLLEEALDRFRLQQSTAIGSAILESLAVLPGRSAFLGERLARLRTQNTPDPQLSLPPPVGPPPAVGDLPPAAIVIFSDGVTNTGVDPLAPAMLALEGKVKVHTVGMGQQGGSVMSYRGAMVFVPFDASSLQALSQRTGGEHMAALDEERLRRIAQDLRRSLGWERRPTEITSLAAAAAALLMAAGAALSLLWFRRVP